MDEGDFISKTQRKKRMAELQALGEALVELPAEQLARLELPEALREAVVECRGITKHEARRRQGQYIGRLMRDLDPAPIAEQLARLQAPSRRQTALFHVAERWRSELIEDPASLERFVREFPEADARELARLVEAARAERSGAHGPRRFRELFHAVNAAVQQQAKGT